MGEEVRRKEEGNGGRSEEKTTGGVEGVANPTGSDFQLKVKGKRPEVRDVVYFVNIAS